MLKPFLAAITVAASFSFITASAQDTAPAPIDTRIVTSVTLNDMWSIVTGYEHTVVEELLDERALVVQTPGGYKYVVSLRMCDDAGACEGVLISALHDLPAGMTWEIMNQLDSQLEAFGLYVSNDQLVVDRMMILSGGVQVENFKHEIGRLIIVAPAAIAGVTQSLSEAAEG